MKIPDLFSDTATSTRLCLAVLGVYFILAFIGILHHELWLDEAHHFLLSLWSNSLSELFFNARYDGHPFAWNILLFIITRFSSDPFGMQVLNVLISCIGVAIFLRVAPFSLPFKLLSVFGYFCLYEYGIISRNYALSSALFFAVLAIYPYRSNHRILFALMVALFANTHLFSALVAGVLLVQMLLEYLFSSDKGGRKEISFAFALIFFGIVLALYQCIPPNGSIQTMHSGSGLITSEEWDKIISMPFRGIFLLPDVSDYYNWNTNYFTIHYWNYCKLLFPLPAILAFILLNRKPLSLFFFLFASMGIMVLAYFSLSFALRHCGFIYLNFIGALWMSRYEPDNLWLERVKWLDTATRATLKPAMVVIWFILLLQIASSGIMYAESFSKPFSESKEVSQYLAGHGPADKFIMVSDPTIGPQVSAYLHRKVFQTEAGIEGTFCHWELPWQISDSALITKIVEQLQQHRSIVILLNRKIPALDKGALTLNGVKCGTVISLKAFDHALVRSENYYVYLVVK